MRAVIDQFVAALTRSAATGSKSTALAPLHGMLALVLGAFLISLWLAAPTPVLILFGVFCTCGVVLEAFAYVYLLFIDRDALRSERYTLEKMRLEKGIIGDTTAGFRVAGAVGDISTRALPAADINAERP